MIGAALGAAGGGTSSSQHEMFSNSSGVTQTFGGLDKSINGIDNQTLLGIAAVVAVAVVVFVKVVR